MYSPPQFSLNRLQNILRRAPNAEAAVRGGPEHPSTVGTVSFYQMPDSVLVVAQIRGLPHGTEKCAPDIFGFHIHAGSSCTGNTEDPFADTDGHYNPGNCPHPAHAGDLPPLFGSHGSAFLAVLTDRFSVSEVIGRTVVVHAAPDDFTTQPSGNSGAKIACGRILPASGRHR